MLSLEWRCTLLHKPLRLTGAFQKEHFCLFSLERGYLLTVSRDLNQGNEGTVPPKDVRFFSLFWQNILIRTLETPLLGLSETCRIFRRLNL